MALQQKYLECMQQLNLNNLLVDLKKKKIILFFTQLHHNCNNG